MINIKEYLIDDNTNSIFLNNKNMDFISLAWKNKSKVWGDPLHKTCAYNAMFPVRIADFFIKKYSNEGDVVLDPFSGRGTTLLQSRILNRKSYGSDLNPMSYVLSKSKLKNLDLEKVISGVENLERSFKNFNKINFFLKYVDNLDTMKIYYSEFNLNQISFLREKIGKNWKKNSDIDNFILSICLGLMHGPSKKNGTSSYFSLSMSNSISMSPNYVNNYALKKELTRHESDIFQLIISKIKKVYLKRTEDLKRSNIEAEFRISNALKISKTWKDIEPKLIFTSPPYLNIINYTKQNWLKMWMLGYGNNSENKKIGLDDYHKENTYLNHFLINFMKECSKIMSANLATKLVMVIGDVIKNNIPYSIFDHRKYIEESTGLALEEVYVDKINQNFKSTNSMGTKAGKATQTERIYVFSKKININPEKKRE